MSSFFKPLILILSALAMVISIPTLAQETIGKPVPFTSKNPTIDPIDLDIMAAPLTVEELKGEADSWLELLKEQAHKVADAKIHIRQLEAKLKDQTEAGASTEKLERTKNLSMQELTELRSERTALIDRLNIILDRINQKIGLNEAGQEKEDVLVYRNYIDAVGGIKIYAEDSSSAFASIKGWLFSKEGGLRWALNIGIFLAIIFAFWLLAHILRRATRRGLKIARYQSRLLTDFIEGMVFRSVMIIGIIVGLSALEVSIGPLLAVVGAAGFVVAFALQSTLSNFASGIMIMLYRPFDVNDTVEVAGITGKVSDLNLVSTTITTFDNKRMLVPNNEIWGNVITNATASTERRVDMTFGIGYEDDIDHALEVLEEIVAAHPLVLKNPAAVIQLNELADSSVNFICRPWTKTSDYWTVYWDITRRVKERFDAENLSIPYPQRDVHIYQEPKSISPTSIYAKHGDTSSGTDQMGFEPADSSND